MRQIYFIVTLIELSKNSAGNWNLGNLIKSTSHFRITLTVFCCISGTGVTTFVLHPGIVRTELARNLDSTYFPGARILARIVFSPFSKTPEEGALTTLYTVLADNESECGSYYRSVC